MVKAEIINRVKKIMAAIFNISEEAIGDDSSMDNIESWDSLRHINLIIALEQEFGIAFNDEEVPQLTSVQLLSLAVADALA